MEQFYLETEIGGIDLLPFIWKLPPPVAAGSGTSGTSLVPFYFESLEFFVLISNMSTMQKSEFAMKTNRRKSGSAH